MSYSIYSNTFRNFNNNNNVNLINNRNPYSPPLPSSQLNSAGRIASIPINYHFLQKESEKQSKNLNQNQMNTQENKNIIKNSLLGNYKPESISNINSYRKKENNKANDFINNNKNNNTINNYHHNNYLRRNYHNINYHSRNNKDNKDNKEIKLQSNLIFQKKAEDEKTLKAKTLMDDFDKKLYDTISNFGPRYIKKPDEKSKNFENGRDHNNLNPNFRKRNFSYDKFNINNLNNNTLYNNFNNNNNNYIQNYNQRSTLHNTDTLYKNFFGNNGVNIYTIHPNEKYNNNANNYNLNNYSKYNNNIGVNFNRNQRNSMDKIMLNKYQNQNSYLKTPNIEVLKNTNLPKKKYIIKNYSFYSLGGTDAFKHPKTNQDSYLTKEDSNNFIFGVFDGHGFEGHLLSQAIKNYLNNNLSSSSFSSKENIITIFKNLSSSINSSTSFNAMESGSTVVLTFISNNALICANCGDSRAILISEKENKIIPQSRDHKPELTEKKKRILDSGGRVDKICGLGPFRVWLKDAEYPGLAMSRSIGDGYAHKVGVIDIPEIMEFNLDEIKPRAVILASDGVFEFVKNEEINEIVGKYYFSMDSQGCAKEIVDYSRKVWEKSGYAIDDITCIVGFFEESN